jgi:hypothetical protein
VGSRSARNSALGSGTTRSWRPLMIVTGAAICGPDRQAHPPDTCWHPHRLHEAVAVGAGEVIRVNVVRYSAPRSFEMTVGIGTQGGRAILIICGWALGSASVVVSAGIGHLTRSTSRWTDAVRLALDVFPDDFDKPC